MTPDHELIAGRRRLDCSEVPVHVVPLAEIVRGEITENVARLDLQPSELDAARRRLAPLVRAAAKGREQGRHRARRIGRAREEETLGYKLPEGFGDARDTMARALDTSGRTLEKTAEADPRQDRRRRDECRQS